MLNCTQHLLKVLDEALLNPSLLSIVSDYSDRPFVIYGAGPAGKCICDILLKIGVKPEFILDSHAKNLPSHYLDIPIYLPNQHYAEDSWKKEAIVLVCVIQGTEIHDLVAKNLAEDGFVTIIPWIQKAFSPEIIKTRVVEPRLENFQEQILSCAELFKDNLSRETYLNIMTACLLRCFDNLNFSDPEEQYFPTDIEMRKGYQSFIDCGAFCGDTFNKLVEKHGTPQVYIAFEPDYRNFSILAKCVDKISVLTGLLFPCAVSSCTMPLRFTLDQIYGGAGSTLDANGGDLVQCVAIDECLHGVAPTFMKFDIEGSEIDALIGAKKLIERYKPDLAIAVYHYADHYFTIPNLINKWDLGYQFYLRTYDKFGNETILYATC